MKTIKSQYKNKPKKRVSSSQKQRYCDYLKSAKWKSIRQKIIKRDDSTCTSCGIRASKDFQINNFEIHHINYKHIFKEEENLESLRLVCKNCHQKITKAQQRGRKKANLKKGITVSIDMSVFRENFESLHTIMDKATMLLRMNKNHSFINEEFNKCFRVIIEKLEKKDLNLQKNTSICE